MKLQRLVGIVIIYLAKKLKMNFFHHDQHAYIIKDGAFFRIIEIGSYFSKDKN
jgi:hypothetical protein